MNNIAYLLSVDTIRSQAKRVFDAACNGKTSFLIHLEKLDQTADFVLQITKQRYPDLNVPPHTRFRHLNDPRLQELDVRQQLDLVMISVLLDAGAGKMWRYFDARTQTFYARSEGLAVASFNMFYDGLFGRQSAQVDANTLKHLTLLDLRQGFQSTEDNLLVGLEGRLHLLQALGATLQQQTKFFGSEQRPAGLYDFLTQKQSSLSALQVLSAVQHSLGSIWPGRLVVQGFNLGDVWHYPPLKSDIPFHKLSQWLTYSLLEPLSTSGIDITDIEQLTGLAEYRNGGLFLDMGVLQLREPNLAEKAHRVDSEIIVEWRALTIHLLEEVAQRLRALLQLTPQQFPMAKVLEGGTWSAGRLLAEQKRQGNPPLNIVSDATVF